MDLNKWRIFCITDSKYEYDWKEIDDEPTTCPVNTAHSINSSLNRVIETRKADTVKIKEEEILTGGHFSVEGICFTALANQTTSYSISFPYPINVINIQFPLISLFSGDSLYVETAPDTIVGTITSDVTTNDTVINVSQTVIDNIYIGYRVKLDDTTNIDDLLRVTAVDRVNLTITVETPSPRNYLAATPTYVKMSIRYLNVQEFNSSPIVLGIGNYKIGASYIPSGVNTTCTYVNNSTMTDKKVVAYIEYLY